MNYNFYELPVVYDARASFYGKAQVIIDGDKKILKSYESLVCMVENGQVFFNKDIESLTSQTTLRHIKDFLKQNGFNEYEAKKDILKGARKAF